MSRIPFFFSQISRKYRYIFFQSVALTFLSISLFAQGWERSYEVAGYEAAYAEHMVLTEDGGYCIVGTAFLPGLEDIVVLKLDAEGNEQWTQTYGGNSDDRSRRILKQPDGGFVIGGLTFSFGLGSADYYLLKIDAFGNEIWSETYGTGEFEELNGLAQASDGGFLLMGEAPPNYNKIYLIKTDASGQQVWDTLVGPELAITEGRDIQSTADGGFIISGYTQPFGNPSKNFFIIKINQNGEVIWEKSLGGSFSEQADAVVETSDGSFVSAGFQIVDASQESDLMLVKVNENGDSLWLKTFGVLGSSERAFTLTETPDGGFLAFGNSTTPALGVGFMVMTDSEGNEIFSKYYTEDDAIGFPSAVYPTPNGGYAIAGTGDSIIALVQTDLAGNSWTTYIQGNVFHDLDNDCQIDSGEEDLAGWTIMADGVDDYFATTDAQGNYSLLVDTGNYVVRAIMPNQLWETCQDYPLILNDFYDTTIVDIPVKSVIDCSKMSVDVATPFLERCEENTYQVRFCNTGTIDENNAQIEIQFDEFLTVNTAGMTYTDLGDNLFLFDIGTVAQGACETFSIDVTLDCDSTILGQTHCVEARIFPDSFCVAPAPNWDGSSIEVDAVCDGDSVIFKIENVGVSPMLEPRVVQIIQDDIITLYSLFDLSPGQVDTFIHYPAGHTVRLEAEQAPGHPGMSHPSVTVEGCDAMTNFSLGYVTQFPMDDEDVFVDIDCRENVETAKHNNKFAFPKGYTSENLIEANGQLEYVIDFQNISQDTVQELVIRDTLSPHLDPSSVKPGASSHPYLFEIMEAGVLKFTFSNIILPDSTLNENDSRGFVKFTVAQKEDLPPGTIIHNQAAIYFDYHAPTLTDTVTHVIEYATLYFINEEEICEGDEWMGHIIISDTIFTEVHASPKEDSVFLTKIYMLEHSYSELPVMLNQGDIFDGTIYWQDSVFVKELLAANGCDSLQTVFITVDEETPLADRFSFEAYPNPSDGAFTIDLILSEKEQVQLELFDALGQKILTLEDNTMLPQGKHIYHLNMKNKAMKMVFLHLKTENRSVVRRLIFEK